MDKLSTHDQFHRAYVGAIGEYDFAAAWQFNFLTMVLGLREFHSLLEIGCGSLRVGRLLIPYLQAENYYGLEPNEWLVRDGLAKEVGFDLANLRRPTFRHEDDFGLRRFGRNFDFMLAQSIFSHTSQAQIATCLAEARQVLAPQGVFAATYCEGASDYEGTTWVYPECVEFTRGTIQRLAEAAGLRSVPIEWGNPNRQRWVLFHHSEHDLVLANSDSAIAQQANAALQKGRTETAARTQGDPAEYVKLRDRLAQIARNEAVQAAMMDDVALRQAVLGQKS